MPDDRELVHKHVKELILDCMDYLVSLISKQDREELFNTVAQKFQIKVQDLNKKKQPMHIEMVRDNFNHIVSTLKIYEIKQT